MAAVEPGDVGRNPAMGMESVDLSRVCPLSANEMAWEAMEWRNISAVSSLALILYAQHLHEL